MFYFLDPSKLSENRSTPSHTLLLITNFPPSKVLTLIPSSIIFKNCYVPFLLPLCHCSVSAMICGAKVDGGAKILSFLQPWVPRLKDFLCWVNAVTVALMRAIGAVLTEKSKCRASDHFPTRLSMNGDRVLQELSTEKVRQVVHVPLSVFTQSGRDRRILHVFFRLFRDAEVSVRVSKGGSFVQVVLKNVTVRSASTKVLPPSGIAVPTTFDALIFFIFEHSYQERVCQCS